MTHEEGIRKLRELIKNVKVAMLTTVEPGGHLRSRPMQTQSTEIDGQLWFFTRVDSSKVTELQREQHVNLSYAAPDDDTYVSVSGRASVSQDREKMKELWSPVHKAWFPKGLDDPAIALVCVDIDHAEYWDAPSGKLIQLAGLVKAVVTGERYQGEGADHQKITL